LRCADALVISETESEQPVFLVGSLAAHPSSGKSAAGKPPVSGISSRSVAAAAAGLISLHLHVDRFDEGTTDSDGVRRPAAAGAGDAWISVRDFFCSLLCSDLC